MSDILDKKYGAKVTPSIYKLHRARPLLPVHLRADLYADIGIDHHIEILDTVAVNIAQSELSKLVQDLEDSTDMKNFIRQHGLGQQFEHWQTIEILRRV